MRKISEGAAQRFKSQICIRVPTKAGNKAIRFLSQSKILDRNLRPEVRQQTLLIPILHRPNPVDLTAFEEMVGNITLGKHKFQRNLKLPSSLREALAEKLSGDLSNLIPHSYDIIGDIALLELPSQLEPYERALADAVLRVNKNVRVVLAKAGEISGTRRILPTRYLAGENRTETIHKESGCRFKVDVSKAYFSPRLSHEHERVVVQVGRGEVVTDLFAGVGPFSIMIAKRFDDLEVNAIDANRSAIKLMKENVKLNKIKGKLTVWSGDAREVVEHQIVGRASRVIMNHPAEAKDFVDVACNALKSDGGTIHYYTFADGANSEDKAVDEFKEALARCNWRITKLEEVHRVRGVSPMKWQVAVDAKVAPTRAWP